MYIKNVLVQISRQTVYLLDYHTIDTSFPWVGTLLAQLTATSPVDYLREKKLLGFATMVSCTCTNEKVHLFSRTKA